MTNDKPIIQLPLNPSNYYGKATTVYDISKMNFPLTFYVGNSTDVEEMNFVSLTKLDDDLYRIETDKATLMASSLTRVNLKSDHKI